MLLCFRLLLLPLFFCSSICICNACRQSDRKALFSLSSTISAAPPLNWSATDCCHWEGIRCDEDGWVNHLQLPSRGLRGNLSSKLQNLTRLLHLNLSHNSLYGSLPGELFSSLYGLEIIDLSYNTFSGNLPPSAISSSVRVFDISSNRFEGEIHSSFSQKAWNLGSFNVSSNSFSNFIPSSICSNSSFRLEILDFSFNGFGGSIPSGLGDCTELEVFRAGFNSLTGEIPEDLYRASRIREISLPGNQLSGKISDRIVNLSRLRVFELNSNRLNGTLPHQIGKLSNLEYLLLNYNNLTGNLPSSLSNCTNLIDLEFRKNYLNGDLTGLDFSKLLRLEILDLAANYFIGRIPLSLYSCKSLKALRLATNELHGQVSEDIASLQSLSYLSISRNVFTNVGRAVRALMKCRNLTTLIFSKNFYGEAMPEDHSLLTDAVGLQNLQVFSLRGCWLSGKLPAWLANAKNLRVLELSFNHIKGSIPGWLSTLSYLFYIDLSFNHIYGEIPKSMGRISALGMEQSTSVSYLDLPLIVNPPNNGTLQEYKQVSSFPRAIYLRNNNLSGNIPVEISHLKGLHILDLSFNNLSGSIPAQLSNLTNLETLDLSENQLSGQIPMTLIALNFLSLFRVVHNRLEGPIPMGGQFDTFTSGSFDGNPKLCGAVVHRPCRGNTRACTRPARKGSPETRATIGIILGIYFGIGLVLSLLALCLFSTRRTPPPKQDHELSFDSNSMTEFDRVEDTNLFIVFPDSKAQIKDLTIFDILKATNNFNQEYIIGCGAFGMVYKVTLANGTKLAVKKLSGEMGLMEREFRAEVEALSIAQHKNLISLQGYYIHDGFRLLVYPYMKNKSLDHWLHEKIEGASQLDWPTRFKIMKGASHGLAYLHHICKPYIIHRDIKSNNILLDEKFEAYLADFGHSRLIFPYHLTHVTTELVGTLGYIPPEYGQVWVATLKGDIYSFGVVMLELLTGRRAYQVLKQTTARELASWVHQMRSKGQEEQIYDPLIKGLGYEEQMIRVLDVACMCVNPNPLNRPTIRVVVDLLENILVNSHTPDTGPLISHFNIEDG